MSFSLLPPEGRSAWPGPDPPCSGRIPIKDPSSGKEPALRGALLSLEIMRVLELLIGRDEHLRASDWSVFHNHILSDCLSPVRVSPDSSHHRVNIFQRQQFVLEYLSNIAEMQKILSDQICHNF